MAKQLTLANANEPKDLSECGVFIHIMQGVVGTRRKVDSDEIEVAQDKTVDTQQLNVTKSLMACPEYKAIVRMHAATKEMMKQRSIWVPFYREAYYFIPFERGEETIAMLEERKTLLASAAKEFVAAYPRIKADAKERLKHLYRENDYPSAEYVLQSIYLDWEIKEESVPKKLAKLGAKVFRAELKKQQGKAAALVTEMRYALRAQMQELVAHLADRLSPDAKGEKKIFRDTAVTNLTEWLQYFEPKTGVTDDAALAALAAQVKQQLAGVDIETLRTDAAFRSKLQSSMAEVKSNLDGMLKDRPTRLIASRDEEV